MKLVKHALDWTIGIAIIGFTIMLFWNMVALQWTFLPVMNFSTAASLVAIISIIKDIKSSDSYHAETEEKEKEIQPIVEKTPEQPKIEITRLSDWVSISVNGYEIYQGHDKGALQCLKLMEEWFDFEFEYHDD